MKILLSIKPEYAEKIFNGEKKYEYRKKIFKRKDVKSIIVYVTKPVGKVIGEFEIDQILEGEPSFIWEKTKKHAGISSKDYFKYFDGNDKGFAIGIKKVIKYQEPLELQNIKPTIKTPPQSFIYVQ